ncbi:uncharacterized protein LOC111329164 [Stylophora pistillata]|uniref:uncharacterized protein LOC111329164 n=1 Tax=Stylophora pistillata TaxID=50429 RepID=UPI000C039000|nr:uncharacterized protein LOC111329164 [Stylophora pistillata]
MKPTFSTVSSDWVRIRIGKNGFAEASHDFLGVKLKTSVISVHSSKTTSVKFRIINKLQYEPFLEENERRVSDIIQIYPKEFVFEPSAELILRLPNCVAPKSCGQLVCLYCSNVWARHGVKHLKWKPIDSFCFHVNAARTEARIICRKSGLFTIKMTQHPQSTKNLDPYTDCEVELTEYPGIQIKFPAGCVSRKTPVTLETVCTDELYSLSAPAPTSSKSHSTWILPQNCDPRHHDESNLVDVTSSPVVLIRPSKFRFTKPIQLTLPLLGDGFEDFFSRENARVAVLQSKVLDEDLVLWKHHYSTPEIKTAANGLKIASFLITRGGLYKLVRRIPNNNPRYVEQIAGCISRELHYSDNDNNNFVTTSLRGLMTEIAEPGKQFVLRVALFDNAQPRNPDNCFISEVCSQPLTLPLGNTRFLVRGSFVPDMDAADRTDERIVIFTGKTTFVDFYLKFRLSDPTKLPDFIGKVSVHGAGDMQFFINLHKPKQIEDLDPFEDRAGARIQGKRKKTKQLQKRQTVAEFRSLRETTIQKDDEVSS